MTILNWLMCAIYVMIFAWSVATVRTIYGSFFNPLIVFLCCWCIFPAIASTGVLGLYNISVDTHFIILLSIVSFWLAYNQFGLNLKKTDGSQTSIQNYVNYKLMIVVNVAILIWLSGKMMSSLAIIQSRGWAYLRAVANDNFSETTTGNIFYVWFIKPAIISSLAVLSFDLLHNKMSKAKIVLLLVSIANLMMDVIIFSARASIVKFMIYMFFSLFFCKVRTYTKSQKFVVFLIAVSLFCLVVFITGERMSGSGYGDFSFLDSIAMYYAAPFGLLNYYVENPDFSKLFSIDGMTFGSATFGLFYNIFRSALYVLLGMAYNGSDYNIQLVTQHSIRVGTEVSINSGYTAAYVFLRDFGIIGIPIGFSLMAYVICKCHRLYRENPTTRTGTMYIFILYIIFRLSASYDFLSPSTFFSIVYIYIFTCNYSLIIRKYKAGGNRIV